MWLWSSKRTRVVELDQLASMASRLALFLRAGLSTPAAWGELAHEAEQWQIGEAVQQVNRSIHSGLRHREAVRQVAKDQGGAWQEFSAVISVAELSGAPLSESLWSYSETLREQSRAEREIRALIQAPKLTVGLLLSLPPLGMLVSGALGVNALATLTESVLGWFALSLAAVLVGLALWWMRSLVRQATPANDSGGLERELFAIAVSSGLLPESALQRVHQVMDEHGLVASEQSSVFHLAQLSRRAGVPVARLARAEAKWFLDRRRTDAEEAAASLSVRILIPVGLFILPAFALLAVVPVVVSLLGQAVRANYVPW